MKKIFLLFICIIGVLLTTLGCENNNLTNMPNANEDTQTGNTNNNSNNDSETIMTNLVFEFDNEEYVNDGEFFVKSKKFDYSQENILLLDIENKSNKNYSLTISVTYLNSEGIDLKTEEIKFVGFSAGYRNNFIFQPEITFDSMKYTIFTEAFDGECYAAGMILDWQGLREYNSLGETMLYGFVKIESVIDSLYDAKIRGILFDKNNEIISIDRAGHNRVHKGDNGEKAMLFATTPEGKGTWNKNFDEYSYLLSVIETVYPKEIPVPFQN